MTRDTFLHIVGWLCLIAIAEVAIFTMIETVAPQWRRIWRLATGHIDPVPDPVTPAASDARAASAFPQHHVDEAVAVPALQVRA
ncbi:MAG: hypothetical protein V3V60_08475 [Sphingomonas aquatilis]|uniref:hypothetical protein n=1 Tax=Sphingomonas aquatilis TaxID=93063 RepID=UPI002F304350